MSSLFSKLLQENTTDPDSYLIGNELPDQPAQTFEKLIIDIINIKKRINDLKKNYPEDVEEEKAKALDDCSSALDIAQHHLLDIIEDL